MQLTKSQLAFKNICLFFFSVKANLKTEVTRKQSTPNFPKNEYFLPPETHTYESGSTTPLISWFANNIFSASVNFRLYLCFPGNKIQPTFSFFMSIFKTQYSFCFFQSDLNFFSPVFTSTWTFRHLVILIHLRCLSTSHFQSQCK